MKYIVIIILFFFSTSYSQDNVDSTFSFSKYEHFDYEKKGDKIRTILNENKEALIINFNNGKYISLKNNEINCYTTCRDSIINVVKLKNIDAVNCKTFIDTLVSIDPIKIIDGIDEKNAGTFIQDGGACEVTVFKDNKTLKLYSYSPEIETENRFPSPKNTKSFINSYLNLPKYFYDKEFERVKSLDTIYLFIKRGKNIQYIVDVNKSKNIQLETYLFNFNCISGQFIYSNRVSQNSLTVFYKKKSFLKTNSNKILNFDYLQKFYQCDLNLLIASRMKKVFIIDKDEIKGRKIKIKEVRGGAYCF